MILQVFLFSDNNKQTDLSAQKECPYRIKQNFLSFYTVGTCPNV